MAINAFMFGKAMQTLLSGEWNFNKTGDMNLKCILLTDAQSTALDVAGGGTAQDDWVYRDSISSEVAQVNGYTGGVPLENKAFLTYDGVNNKVAIQAKNVSWGPTATITARFSVIYYDTTDANTSPLVAFVDFGENKTCTNGTFTVRWSDTGIASFSATNNIVA
jgi:hypothetical protein